MKSYPSDLTEKQFEMLLTFIPKLSNKGRPPKWQLIKILNAILYVVRSGCAWRMLPHEFPPWQSVYYHFAKWKTSGLWKQIHDALVIENRIKAGRNPTPSAAVIDSQSVKTTEIPRERGYDAGKKVNGRKRHILVDTMGLIIGYYCSHCRYPGPGWCQTAFRTCNRLFSEIEACMGRWRICRKTY